MIRYLLLPVLAAGPALAHGVHAPVGEAWHAAAHLVLSAGLALAAGGAGLALIRALRRRR